ncbi:MAG TPA: Uma2 family endonuclease [Chloroflexota bacterium]|nr:Uma2 family endonuclease [Chloroflexota bacterium]
MGAQLAPIWLHDDTEEDLVGADWHQEAIVRSVDSLQDHAETEGLPWHVGNQLTLVAWKPDGAIWRPSPDVMIHLTGGPQPREQMDARVDGLPALVIEVVSKTTWRYDQDVTRGKAWGYLALGIPELLLFDPSEEYLDPPCRGWRLEEGQPRAWQPDEQGRFQSALGIAFQPEGLRLRVLDAQLRPISFRHEKTSTLAEQRLLIEQQQRLLAAQAEQQRLLAAQAEQQLAVMYEARIARLEAELANLRGEEHREPQ